MKDNESAAAFNAWNVTKQKIDARNIHPHYHAREIWWVALGKNIGNEQDGSGDKKQRPVLVLKEFGRDVCLIIPLTTSVNAHMYRVPIGLVDGQEARALISQMRVIDTKRLLRKIEMLPEAVFELVQKKIKDML